ncbi:hypothetical protein C3941_19750 [Kaistia algarum]|uniref:DUF2213 domain-containing protein n=1 Tax=Kaistia algarum TaxID=2083279 RepID=UPI000CE89C5F|nr:DUF2213 domain-containing protein [Kaistia algarum]MCX5516226.1 DUF2213 domain-containing protein [Kaistia algarum]PPE78298.1 hypothetical protein C3941_19750 [Kaistia algarum]
MTQATADRSPVLVDGQIGRTRYLTPEGFLFCDGVRIARVGPMLYRHDEVPDIEPSGPGMVTITRDPDVLFSSETLASFNGKPVTNNHPPEFVLPANWRAYSIGTVLDPRRGDGIEADYLIADLLITDKDGIDDVLAGKREVSCGYDGPREQVKPGLGRQTKIVGNHVALVERGRAGPACAIQDQSQEEEPKMAAKKRSPWDRIRTAFKAQDEAALEEELQAAQAEEAGDEPQRIVIEVKQPDPVEAKAEDEGETGKGEFPESLDARLTKIEQSIATLAETVGKLAKPPVADEDPAVTEKDKDKDKPDATMDSATLRDAFADVRAKAEILSPGISLPTFDAKAKPTSTQDAMAGLRLATLKAAYADPKRKPHVEAAFGGKAINFDTLTADAAEVIFNAASAIAAAANKSGRPSVADRTFPQGPMTAAKYDALIKERRASARAGA